jgi:(1->4)-alpha-D-glucan 1-alpha-D-glucosylmutase
LRFPTSTYRIQLNRGFGFRDARAIVPYLSQLGISDIYSPPIFRARPGSSHGYDVVDPSSLNPELGTKGEFEEFASALDACGMGLLLDTVPNHLAAGPDNPWWMDVLENGPISPYAAFFDIDWTPVGDGMADKVILPILGRPYVEALQNGEIVLRLDDAGLFATYRDTRLPLDVRSYGLVISHFLANAERDSGTDDVARQLRGLLDAMDRLSVGAGASPETMAESYQQRQLVREMFRQVVGTSARARAAIINSMAQFNAEKGKARSFDLLDKLLAEQAYELVFWKTGVGRLNYRRFFDISDLIGVRTEDSGVFDATHALVLRLVQEGRVTGLRIDHIDGLYNPLEYLCRLQDHLAPPRAKRRAPSRRFYVLAEKILTGDETVPKEWPVSGTTGYDFLKAVNGLFVDAGGIRALDAAHSEFTGAPETFEDVVHEKKKQVIEDLFCSELHRLANSLSIAAHASHDGQLPVEEPARAIAAVTACLPVYRSYVRGDGLSPSDRRYLEHAFREARQREPDREGRALALLERVLFLDFPDGATIGQRNAWLHFVMQWQQFTGPVMAKGFEDTALYCYNRLISLNEVGGDPGAGVLSPKDFHKANASRNAHFPSSMNATSTHDTKRSEDVRARINVISEEPSAWAKRVSRWANWNQPGKQHAGGQPVPEPAMETFIYQTLIGAWPLSTAEMPEFRSRLASYVIKAAREAKVHTNWLSPDEEYESALVRFVESILDPSSRNGFLRDFQRFQARIAYYGALNSLGQVLLKATSPGVPDFYQGQELWDFSLADPDNRRAVDFEKRVASLHELVRREEKERPRLVRGLLRTWRDGRIKLYVTHKALEIREANRGLFLNGRYIPLYPRGGCENHVCAFARCDRRTWVLTAVPRFTSRLVRAGTAPVGQRVWGDSTLQLPASAPERWLNAFTGETCQPESGTRDLSLSAVFRTFPVALLVGPA